MKKILHWGFDNVLFVLTLFLLSFIPLYPKIPVFDVVNTWVYIRLEDFVVAFVLIIWSIQLFSNRISLRTPLTLPILIFWLVTAIATIHGVLLIFPQLANVFPNVAFLSFLRRIEYLSLFFVAFAGLKDRRLFPYVIVTLVITLMAVVGYGIGQKYFGFPAYLTMNEEFAKGLPIQLSSLSRVPSTFAGHYDLAAYLVLIIPILTSLIFGLRKPLARIIILLAILAGFILLFMTVSRVSVFVLLASLFIVLLLHKKKLALLSLPIIAIFIFIFLSVSSTLLERFGNTVKEVNVLVDSKTGEAIGHVKFVPAQYFDGKVVKRRIFENKNQLVTGQSLREASPSAVVIPVVIPSQAALIIPSNAPTGENLPQGTGYINLTLSPISKKLGEFFYDNPKPAIATDSAQAFMLTGDFLIKKAAAYDLSFTTRFQGEWPQAMAAFKRNVLFGSGYGSVSLAVDNNYLRILGEVGILGFASFLAIFLTAIIYINKVLPKVDDALIRSFVLGFVAGVFGLSLNALLIDVFEASKVAFVLWLLTGLVLGALGLYQKEEINLYQGLKNLLTGKVAMVVYLLVAVVLIFSPMIGNFFVGDDFTWLRWTQEKSSIFRYFTDADGFFYRPGAKIYFQLMHSLFWLNQEAYHIISISLHFIVAVLVFLLSRKILGNFPLAVLASFLFLILSGYSEAVFWISATGFLFTSVFSLLSLLFFIFWEEKKKTVYFVSSVCFTILALLFHELGIVTPLFILAYKLTKEGTFNLKEIWSNFQLKMLFLPIPVYLVMRFIAGSHWSGGDYSYNLLKLPFNTVGNLIGYLFLTLFGPSSLPFYNILRNFSKEKFLFSAVFFLILLYILFLGYRIIIKKLEQNERGVVIFGLAFFVIALLPFLGLGNIASRYSYLASFGTVLLLVFFIQKLYYFFKSQSQNIAWACVSVVTALFFLLQIIQIQQIHNNWREAGDATKRFFVAIDALYVDYWTNEPMKFYFVNTPIRHGEAWVFPVGIGDALWQVLQNPNSYVYQSPSVNEALSLVDGSKNEKVLEFNQGGKLVEHKKLPNDR